MLELDAELEALSKRPTSFRGASDPAGGSPFILWSFSWAIGMALTCKPSCTPDMC